MSFEQLKTDRDQIVRYFDLRAVSVHVFNNGNHWVFEDGTTAELWPQTGKVVFNKQWDEAQVFNSWPEAARAIKLFFNIPVEPRDETPREPLNPNEPCLFDAPELTERQKKLHQVLQTLSNDELEWLHTQVIGVRHQRTAQTTH